MVLPAPPPTLPDRSPEAARVIGEVADRLGQRNAELGARLVARFLAEGLSERPEPDLEASLHAAATSSVALLNVQLATWATPWSVPAPVEALAWARAWMAAGRGLDLVLAAYRMGHAEYLAVWREELPAVTDDAAVHAEAFAAVVQFTFSWVNSIAAPLVVAYEDEQERVLRSHEGNRLVTVRSLLDGTEVDAAVASGRLGYDLDGPHVAAILTTRDPSGAGDGLPRLAGEVAARLSDGGRLVVRLSPSRAAVWVARREVRPEDLDRLEVPAGHRLAVGEAAEGLDGFRSSHDEARRAERVAGLLGRPVPVCRFRDVAALDLLVADPDRARQHARSTLGPLADDDDGARLLLATLRVYVEEEQSFARAARRLHLHENTVAGRVRRALELSGGHSPSSLELRTALELVALLDAPD